MVLYKDIIFIPVIIIKSGVTKGGERRMVELNVSFTFCF
jgi:hypothetical protein